MKHPEEGISLQPVGPRDWPGWLTLGWIFLDGEEPTIPPSPVNDDPVNTPARGATLSSPKYLVNEQGELSNQPVYPADWAGWFNLGWKLQDSDQQDLDQEQAIATTPPPQKPMPSQVVEETDSDVSIIEGELTALHDASGWSALKREAEKVGFEKSAEDSWEDSIPAIAALIAAS